MPFCVLVVAQLFGHIAQGIKISGTGQNTQNLSGEPSSLRAEGCDEISDLLFGYVVELRLEHFRDLSVREFGRGSNTTWNPEPSLMELRGHVGHAMLRGVCLLKSPRAWVL
jgi:hypothetical protein